MPGRISYMPEELAWIEARKDWPRARLHSAFCFMFDRTDVSEDNLRQLCVRKGWLTGPAGRCRTKGTSRLFSAAEMAWLRENAALPLKDTGPAFRDAFPGRTITDKQILTWRRNHKIQTGRTGRFVKGQTPPNKGLKGYVAPGSEKGWFAKGNVAPNTKPMFFERIGKDGYIEIKVPVTNPYTGHRTRFMHKHRWAWEQVNGPLPSGHALKCLDGDKTNTDAANWVAIPRALLPRLNGRFGRDYDSAPADVKPTIMAIAKLEHAAREAKARQTESLT
jgi:hypothetical protein